MSSSVFKIGFVGLEECHQIDTELQNKTSHFIYLVYRKRDVRSEVVKVRMFLPQNNRN
jgi:hypothetical protein